MNETKICRDCEEELPIENFYVATKKTQVRRSWCKVCYNKKQALRRKYARSIIGLLTVEFGTYKENNVRDQENSCDRGWGSWFLVSHGSPERYSKY